MRTVEWSPEMSVGSKELDGHHQIIIDCLNRLAGLLDRPGADAEMTAVVARLEEFVLVHFSEEEQRMRDAGYPDWRDHKAQHDGMYDVVFNLKSDLEHGRALDAHALYELVYDWLVKHILGEDRKYVPYLEHPEAATRSVWTRASGKPC